MRADINMGPDGRPKGSGIVVFSSTDDAQNAVSMYNGYDWNGRQIEVREVSTTDISHEEIRHAHLSAFLLGPIC